MMTNPGFEAVDLPNSKPSPDQSQIESRTQAFGEQIFELSQKNSKGKNYWLNRMMELATADPKVKTQLFRFVDVLPVLKTFEQKKDHLVEYLSRPAHQEKWPALLSLISSAIRLPMLDRAVVRIADIQVRQMARNFIVGESPKDAMPYLVQRRRLGLGFTLDILGESVLSEDEAKTYQQKYRRLIEEVGQQAKTWPKHSVLDHSSLGGIPAANISIKISALDCRMDPINYEESLRRLVERIEPLVQLSIQHNVFLNFDMEQFSLKELTRDLFKEILMKFRHYRHLGIVVQAYLKSAEADIQDWVSFSKKRGTPFTIRLVKGAYWDYEVIVADQNKWEVPVFARKSESDASYERCTRLMLEAYPHIELACGSHNVRSISHALAYREALGLPKDALEFQMLYGMAEPFKTALVQMGMRLREYDPVGEIIPGLSYLVRRLLENTSNDSFLKQSFMDKTGIFDLLKDPQGR